MCRDCFNCKTRVFVSINQVKNWPINGVWVEKIMVNGRVRLYWCSLGHWGPCLYIKRRFNCGDVDGTNSTSK